MITTICGYCGKEFEKYPSQKKKFCSKECFIKNRSKNVKDIEFVCEECGNSFTRSRGYVNSANKKGMRIRFCSRECKTKHWGRNRVEVTCPVCGKKFLQQARLAHIRLCCSPECSAKNPDNRMLQGNNVTLVCPVCKKEFERRGSYIRKTKKKGQTEWCCSRDCAKKYASIKPVKERAYFREKKTIICLHCGNEFQSRAPKKFCSEECRKAYSKRKTKMKKCSQCGKKFKVTGFQAKRERKYCSIECFNQARKIEHNTYEKISHYLRSTEQYDLWRQNVCNAANWKCEKCKKQIDGDLEVHHKRTLYSICKQYNFDVDKIIQSYEFNDIDNGECLCHDCHVKEHPYDNKLRNKKGQFCRLEFKAMEKLKIKRTELSGETDEIAATRTEGVVNRND